MSRLWWWVRNKHISHEEYGRNWWSMCIVCVVNVQCVKRSPSSTSPGGVRRVRAGRVGKHTLLLPLGVEIVRVLSLSSSSATLSHSSLSSSSKLPDSGSK
jgi:hypothetical protein